MMRRCGIMTFHFAHNYGAMLQAKALSEFVNDMGISCEIINYRPKNMVRVYQINPFKRELKVKNFIRGCRDYTRRKKQFFLFENFVQNRMVCTDEISTYSALVEKLRDYEYILFGSDQIWNDKITGQTDAYYGGQNCGSLKKISYAASFGKKQLSAYQKKCVCERLPYFSAVSLREEDGLTEINHSLKKKVEIVLDPVFLQTRQYWENLSNASEIHLAEPYVLYYSLRENENLIKGTEEIAKDAKVKIICIHPTCKKGKVNGELLTNVGPIEFLYLIRNAQYICTNSFHATAFSIIFGKKLYHQPFSGQETRVESVLSRIGAYDDDNVTFLNDRKIVDLALLDRCLLQAEIKKSQQFLRDGFHLN